MLQLLEEARADKKLANSVHFEDGNKLRDGVLKRAPDEMIKYASQYTVSEEQMWERFVEMVDVSGESELFIPTFQGSRSVLIDCDIVYFTAASQRPSKQVKFDFFYIHTVNSSIFFTKILALDFLDTRTKLRLLEAKGRMDLMMYISRNAPELYLDEITKYPISNNWDALIVQGNRHPRDDGHLSKLVRALKNGESVCRPYEGRARELGLKITGDAWLRIGNMGRFHCLFFGIWGFQLLIDMSKSLIQSRTRKKRQCGFGQQGSTRLGRRLRIGPSYSSFFTIHYATYLHSPYLTLTVYLILIY